jgi:transcription termination/antitermination protein NusA
MIMNAELIEALGQIAREKSVDRQVLIETLEAGLVSAAKKKLGANADVRVEFDEESGRIRMYANVVVVDQLTDRGIQITVREATRLRSDARVGDMLTIELPIAEFGRNAIQAAKQVLIQRVREAERDRVFDDYHERVGEVVTGIVQQVDRGSVIVKLDRTEAVLPPREQISRDRYRQGEHLRAMIVAVDRNAKGPQVILSRTSNEFLMKLFESEVPEIADQIVEIRAVAREPGMRSKIAVISHDDKVDPVGACVGIKGSRVQAIVRELNGERIDIVPWSADPIVYVGRALSPAKVKQVQMAENGKEMRVVVEDDQLSLAIGKGGQNARLAAKLTGMKIDLLSEGEERRRSEAERLMRIEVESLPGIGEKVAEVLIRSGIETAAELAAAQLDQLVELPGIGAKTAEKLLASAREALAQRAVEVEAILRERAQEARAAALAMSAEESAETPGEDGYSAAMMESMSATSVAAEANPAAAESGEADAGEAELEAAEPEVAEPEIAEPEVAESEVAESEIAESEVAESEVAESEAAESEEAEPLARTEAGAAAHGSGDEAESAGKHRRDEVV